MIKNGVIPDKNFVDLYTIQPLTSQSNFDAFSKYCTKIHLTNCLLVAYKINLAFQDTMKLSLSKILYHIGKRSCDVEIFNLSMFELFLSSIYHFSQSVWGIDDKKDKKDSLGKKLLIKYLNFNSGKRIIYSDRFWGLDMGWIDKSKEKEYPNKSIIKDFGEKLLPLILE